MIKRNKYLIKIEDFVNEPSLIKIIYGIRRSGKSVLLTQIIENLKEKQVKEDHIIYMNFENLEDSEITSAKD